jgi:hypothetical protein
VESLLEPTVLTQIEQLLGRPFLGYLLNADTDDALAAALARPTEQQANVLSLLPTVAIGLEDQSPFSKEIALADWFGDPAPGTNLPLASILRTSVGGKPPAPTKSKDPVLHQMFRLMAFVYPLLLLPQEYRFPFGPNISGPVHRYAERAQLEEAIQQDPILAKLFDQYSDAGGWVGENLSSGGRGGTVQLWTFAQRQISAAWQILRLDAITPSYAALVAQVRLQVATLRKAIQGKPAAIPVRVGLTGVLVPKEQAEMDLGWARLRSAVEHDRQFIAATGIGGKLSSTSPEGESVAIDYAGDVVVELDVPYVVRVQRLSPGVGWPDDLLQPMQMVDEAVESLRLGLVLALDSAEPVNVALSWQFALDPLVNGLSPSWNDTRRLPNLVPRQLTIAETQAWATWAKRVHEHRTPAIAVSIRRLLQAIGTRNSPDDVLVDAIIVWENLFGASQETGLRLTSSLAWLLGKTAAERMQLQNDFKKLYSARSDIVHGSDKVKSREIPKQSREAVQVSIAALRIVFSERTDLLALGSSSRRSLALMLDGRS